MADYDLGTARGKIDIDAGGAKKGVNEASQAAGKLDDSAKSMGQSSRTAGLALTGLGVAAVAAFGVAVKASADFEREISGFKAVSNATADQIDTIREKALQLGADTAFSAQEAASAMVELAKQGLSVEDVMNGAADATVALAAAGEVDLADAAKISAAALNQFKLNAQDLPHVADLLAGAANASATGVSEVGRALSYVGPVAKAVGLTIEDTTKAIAVLANNGIDASKAGTTLRAILSDLSPTSKKAQGAMRELGLITKDGKNQFFDATGKVKSFRDILEILNKSTEKLTAQQKINYLQTIFGTEALAGINAIAGTTTEEFDKLSKAIDETSASEVAATRLDNLSGSLQILKGSLDTVLIRAGSNFQSGLKGIVDVLVSVVNWLGRLNPLIQKWIGYLIAGGGAIAIFVGGLLLAVDAVQKMKVAFAALNFVVSNNPFVRAVLIIAAVAAAIYAAYKNVKVFHDAVDRLWENFQPIWDGIKEKAGQVADFFQKTVLPKITDAWNAIIDTAKRVGENIQKALGPKVLEAWERLKEAGGNVADFFRNSVAPRLGAVWDTIRDKASGLADWFKTSFLPRVSEAWDSVKEKAGELADWFKTNFLPKITEVWDAIKDGAATIGEKVGPAVSTALDAVRSKADEVKTWFETKFGPAFNKAWSEVKEGAGDLRDWFQTDFAPALQGVFDDKIRPAWESFLNWVNTTLRPALLELAATVRDGISNAASVVQDKLQEVAGDPATGSLSDGIKEKIMTAWNAIINFFTQTVGPAIGNFVAGAIEQWNQFSGWIDKNVKPVVVALGELWDAIWHRMEQVVPAVLDAIKIVIGVFIGIALGLWALFGDTIISQALIIWDTLKGVIEGALQIIRGIINVITGLINGDWGKVWEGIVNILQGAWNIIWAVVSGALETIWNVIQGIMTAIWRLIQAIWGFIVDKTTEAWNDFKRAVGDGIRDALRTITELPGKIRDILGGINLFDIGKTIISGLINGVKSAIGGLYDLFTGITNKIPQIKGPLSKDKKLLVDNGKAIMAGLVSGLQEGWGGVEDLLVGVTNEISPDVGGTNTTNNNTTVNVSFGDIHGANGQQVAAALSDSALLRQITNAARAGVGGRRR